MEKVHSLVQDNGACNGGIKRAVKINNSDLEYELKNYFRWRKNVNIDRLYKLGSHDYDLFIKHLADNGYGV